MEENNKNTEFEVAQTNGGNNAIVIGVVVVLLIAVVSVSVYSLSKNNKSDTSAATSSPMALVTATPLATGSVVATGTYKNGDYTATGDYISPGGAQQIGVTLTLTDGKIEDVEVTPKAIDDDSERYQNIFEKNYKSMVVGKKIDEVKLTKVSGSSLTSRGFQDALDKIKQEAKS